MTGYYEAFNQPNVSLVDLRATPMVRVDRDRHRDRPTGVQEFDIIVWATGFDYGTGALNRMGIRGRDGLALEDHWADGPQTYLGVCCAGFPNLFFPGGPHGAAGNNPRYSGDQVDFITGALVYARDHGFDIVEADAGRRGGVDLDDQHVREGRHLQGDQLLLREQHPRQAASGTCSTRLGGSSSSSCSRRPSRTATRTGDVRSVERSNVAG